jgi:hypothetical protein
MGQQQDQGADQLNDEPTQIGPNDRLVGIGWHWNFGILRCSEFDNEEGYRGFCYEFPSGKLRIYSQREDHNKICFFNQWQDADTGEMYLTFDPRPTAELVEEYGSRTHPGKVKF